MSLSKSLKGKVTDDAHSGSVSPTLNFWSTIRADRCCTNCCYVIKNMAVDRIVGVACPRCGKEVEHPCGSDGTYQRCVRCWIFIKCREIFFVPKNV